MGAPPPASSAPRRRGGPLAWLVALLALLPTDARAGALVADLSSHLIAITTAFAGTEVLLFGAIELEGDVVVVVRGPPAEPVVRRKGRVAGIWLNLDGLAFPGAPAYYAVAATGPLDEIAHQSERVRHEIGVDHLRLTPADRVGRSDEEIAAFRAALIRNKQREGLYSPQVGRIAFVGTRLFRTSLQFPANVPPGSYQVQVLQFRDGEVVNAQSSVLIISKVGLEAELYDFAHDRAPFYGMIAIALAVMSGWTAALLFRKR
jgi:uncharacterized protein (TIGR02186 family)